METNAKNTERETIHYKDICITLFFPADGRTLQDCIVSVLQKHMT